VVSSRKKSIYIPIITTDASSCPEVHASLKRKKEKKKEEEEEQSINKPTSSLSLDHY
jgi:hypothetical protein